MARVGSTLALMSFLGLVAVVTGDVALAQAPGGASEQGASGEKAAPAPKRKAAPKAAKKGAAPAEGQAAAGDAKRDPAATQKSLDAAQKALDSGKTDAAVTQTTSLIEAGGLDSRSMARALALRGHAYKKQGKPAQAIADLQTALYLKNGLNDAERKAAQAARADAYREAGLGDPPAAGGGAGKLVRPAAGPAPVTTAAAAKAEPESGAAAGGSGGGGIGGFFSNLFGGSQSKATSAPETTATAPVRAPAEPAVSSWVESIKPAAGAKSMPKAGTAVATAPAAHTPPAATAKADAPSAAAHGKYRLQLAAQRNRGDAQTMADRVKSEFGAQIGQRSYQIEEAAFGNMGTFYRVNIGPFADATESKALCATLRGKGIDCLVHGD